MNPAEICPLIPSQSGERWKSPETDLTRIFLDVLLELMVSQVPVIEWKDEVKQERQKACFNFLFERFKMYYMPHIFPDFNWSLSLYRPSLELPETRLFRPAFVDSGDGTKKIDPMLACRVVVIKWLAQYTHLTRTSNGTGTLTASPMSEDIEAVSAANSTLNISTGTLVGESHNQSFADDFCGRNSVEGNLVRDILYGNRDNVNFVHEVYRQAFLLGFNHSPAIKKVITVYKDWIQMNVSELPPFLMEPLMHDVMDGSDLNSVRAGLQNVLQIFVTNASNVFLLQVSQDYPILLEEQVEMCKRVLNIYRFMVMNVKMEARTWEQLLFVLLQITQLTLPETPPRRREDTLGGRLAQAIFQTLIVTWIKGNLYVVVSTELWDQFLDVLSSLTLWEELVREWAKTMETLTRVLARQVYNLDLNDLPLDRLTERAQKKKRGKFAQELRCSNPASAKKQESNSMTNRRPPSPGGGRKRLTSETEGKPRKRKHGRKFRKLKRSLSETNVESITSQPELRRAKSLDSWLRLEMDHSTVSRSSSPAPSSGLECGSMKDSPMQLDHDTVSEGGSIASEMLGEYAVSRSVMSGGNVKGWLPDVAVVLWRRMLGSLGNINAIQDAGIHAQIYKYLIELFEIMVKIRNNQGVSLDNLSTPASPVFVPPFTIFAPWCFRALNLPDAYQRGRNYALRLLCLLTCRQHDAPLPKTHLVQFYKVLHNGLTGGGKMEAMNTLIKFTGPRFFSLMLPGYTAYILDFLYAANCIISTSELKGIPRNEATTIVGTLLAFPPLLKDLPLLVPTPQELTLISSADVKDQIIGVLLKSGKKEPAGLARCISLSSLGIFVYSELLHESFHPKIKEAIQVLLTALRFNNKAVAQIASDMLLLLADHVKNFIDFYPEVPKKIVEVLARTLSGLAPPQRRKHNNPIGDDEKRLLLSLLFCLGEWVMRVPRHMLTQPVDSEGRNLLHHVFSALLTASGEPLGPTPAQMASLRRERQKIGPAVMIENFDPNNPIESVPTGQQSPLKMEDIEEEASDDENKSHPIRLATKTILSHLVNHLFHFPMCAGASSLSSMVNEQDDNPFSQAATEELSPEIFKTPNVQFFVLNDATLMSFVELPHPDQVRIIFRDVSGKFSWDVTPLSSHDQQQVDEPDDDWLNEVTGQPSECQTRNEPLLRHRDADTLPTHANDARDLDNLNDLLQHIGHTSPEVLREVGKPLNSIPSAKFMDENVEKSSIASVLGQKNVQPESRTIGDDTTSERSVNEAPAPPQNFQQARRLFSQLGFTSWEKRSDVFLLKKGDQLLREMKHLDAKKTRETHKIAVIYVAEGQEDKHSILSNATGSQAYEEFVSGLGWEVELDSHTGFMGGLSKNRVTGETSVYYATSFVEIMFHVATRMPSSSEESMLSKTRHLGNDEVHVVWSEHWRDYRRGILPTEFCDVLIIVYPLKGNGRLFRVQISRKPDVPYFGPLFNDVIVDGKILPGLIRATAINASRAKRSMLSHYQSHYEERYMTLTGLISAHKSKTTFEDFATQVYSPAPLTNLFIGAAEPPVSASPRSSLTSSTSVSGMSSETSIRPRTKTESSTSKLERLVSSSGLDNEDSTSPRNLKKLTATFKATLNHNINQRKPEQPAPQQQQSSSPTAATNHARLKRN